MKASEGRMVLADKPEFFTFNVILLFCPNPGKNPSQPEIIQIPLELNSEPLLDSAKNLTETPNSINMSRITSVSSEMRVFLIVTDPLPIEARSIARIEILLLAGSCKSPAAVWRKFNVSSDSRKLGLLII